MAQWEEKLHTILNDPQAMGQILNLAQSLGAGGASGASETSTPEALPSGEEPPAAPEAPEAPASSPLGPSLEGLDPRLLAAGMRALEVYRDPPGDQAALLQALKPFLGETRRPKVDRAVEVLRMTRTIRAVLEALGGGEGAV